ncbi:DUF1799 domain-containing protein [Achromobacter piechaudii]|uniref:DUF1799 domain-containing protein n=1 Tax=Achromobacter piechaudii TaxID=72556 RepID=UPI003DA8390F
MAAFYWEPPSADALALAGVRSRPALFRRPTVELWPEHADAFSVFIRNCTQWRMGNGGPIGLDYVAVHADLALYGIEPAKRPGVMNVVRQVERAALELLHKS